MLGLGLAIQRNRMGSLGQQILGQGYFDHYCSAGVSYCSINIGFGSRQIAELCKGGETDTNFDITLPYLFQ